MGSSHLMVEARDQPPQRNCVVSLDTKQKKIMSVTRTNWRDDDINQRIEVTSLDLVLLPGGDTQGVK